LAKNKPVQNIGKKQGKQPQPAPQKQQAKAKPVRNYTWLILLVVVAVTFVTYFSAIYNELVNWDDNRYVYENPLVKSLSFSNLKAIFSTYVGGNYHPFAILSLAIDYNFYGITPTASPGYDGTGYHITSILLHLISVAILFFFCLRLTREVWVAAITSLLFGIHPMHVESVAWVSERKDQLYVLFYFAALFFYVGYLQHEKGKIKYYFLTIIFFIFSLLSKGQGVTLPVVLLGIDYFVKRKWDLTVFLEKLPFLFLSVLFGIIAVIAQKTSHSIQDIKIYPYLDRLMFACYALVGYLYKMILPINLSAFYPYPVKTAGYYPPIIYISPFIILILLGLFALTARKRLVAFGVLFFVANIILLLQLLPVGSAIMSDRYTYLAYTGLFFVFAVLINNIIKNNSATAKSLKPFLFIGLFIYFAFLAITTYARNEVWHTSETLWSDVVIKEPRCGLAYNQLGSVQQKQGKINIAFINFNNAIGLQPDYPEAYVNRSDIYRVRGKIDSAIRDCDTALKYRHNYPEAYVNRGIARAVDGQIDSAMSDFKHAVHLDSDLPNVYVNMGNIYDMKGMIDSAIASYTKAIKLDPNQPSAYENRGRSLRKKGKLDAALIDLNRSIQMDPNAVESYYERSLLYNQKGNKSQALKDAMMARTLGKSIDSLYINSLK
jgi:protein O-mannosyl-transferase